jgi:phenylalanyl-tRNA synthetase beta chain
MKVLLSWLQEMAPIDGSDPVALGETMSDLGMAVEEMDEVGGLSPSIVVAKVLDLRPHPDADRIQLVDVDLGDGEALQIACGAFNMAVGDLVPLATIGTVMPNGMEIARRKMRGEHSNGMLCSARELELGADHDGIYVLPSELALGTPVVEALGITRDVLYDLEINPNRPDAMSVVGVARDVAARLGLPFAEPEFDDPGSAGAVGAATIEIVDPDTCWRFLARELRGVTIGTSPGWMQSRLALCGMRPINSVVDISNYVMLELGHPNHVYDLDKVPGATLRVRRARAGETVVTLDDLKRTFEDGDIAITGADDVPLAIAGVMGGASTEISDETVSVLLEAARWPMRDIAQTSRRMGLQSEASRRNERGIDPAGLDRAVARLCQLLGEAGATTEPGTIDVAGALPEPTRVMVRTPRVNALLGTQLGDDDIRGLLTPIGFGAERAGEGATEVTVPGFRPDTATETDVAEEVARHHGYSKITPTVPRSPLAGGLTPLQAERREVRAALVGLGLVEVMPMPFLAPGDLAMGGLPDDGITLTNPLDANESVLRTSLLPGLLKVVGYNARHRRTGAPIFEVGHVYLPAKAGEPLPDERERLAVALAGEQAPAAVEVWDLLAHMLVVPDVALEQTEVPGLHPTRGARITAAGTEVGSVGEVDPAVLAAFGIEERVAYLEVELQHLLAAPHGDRPYRPVSVYPSSDIDLAFEVDDAVAASAVEAAIQAAGGELLWGVRLFDVFRGEQLGEGRRSLAYTLRLQAPDRTLTDTDVAEVRTAVIDAVQSQLGATLRA